MKLTLLCYRIIVGQVAAEWQQDDGELIHNQRNVVLRVIVCTVLTKWPT
jgi:hypothetical protein